MMAKHLVNWKSVRTKDIYGQTFVNNEFPRLIVHSYRGTLLSEILAMPSKNPISFEEAVSRTHHAFNDAIDAKRIGNGTGECFWFYKNFVRWISDQGFHIEISGDEFEALTIPDKVS